MDNSYLEPYNIALINPSLVKKVCPEIPNSVDDALMVSWIIDVQESSILNLLGCDLYRDIVIQQSGNTFTADNRYLFDRFIVRILAKGVVIRTLYSASYQIENLGVRKKTSDQSDYADKEEINSLKQLYQNDIERLSKDMVLYMNENITKYPEFESSNFCVPCGAKDRQIFSSLKISGI